MAQSATRRGDPDLPHRYVFDEGHHIFDAADSAFSIRLSGQEGMELRRWIRGAENSGRRGKGLKGRVEDLIGDDEDARQNMEQIITAARSLPADGWLGRLSDNSPFGPTENFLALVRQLILTRSADTDPYHSLETPVDHVNDDLKKAADDVTHALQELMQPLHKLAAQLLKKLDDDAAELDSNMRARLESVSRSLIRRADIISQGWIPMLARLGHEKNEAFVDWFELDRFQGRDMDTGMYRHWVDPSLPFVETVLKPAHGAVITSATLRDRTADNENPDIEWHAAEVRTGAAHLITPPRRMSLKSPFNYADQSRIFIVNDMNKRLALIPI